MKAVQEPVTCVCQVGVLVGGDTGQSCAGNGHGSLSTAASVVGTVWWCGWDEAFSTLLGPEGTTVGRPWWVGVPEVVVSPGGGGPAGVWLLFQPGMIWFSYRSGEPALVVVVPRSLVGAVGCGLVVG